MAISITSAEQIKLNSGACLEVGVSDLELGIRALAGYHNYFRLGVNEAEALVQSACDRAGLAWRAGSAWKLEKIPAGAIKVGQVRVHHGDPAHVLYVVQRQTA